MHLPGCVTKAEPPSKRLAHPWPDRHQPLEANQGFRRPPEYSVHEIWVWADRVGAKNAGEGAGFRPDMGDNSCPSVPNKRPARGKGGIRGRPHYGHVACLAPTSRPDHRVCRGSSHPLSFDPRLACPCFGNRTGSRTKYRITSVPFLRPRPRRQKKEVVTRTSLPRRSGGYLHIQVCITLPPACDASSVSLSTFSRLGFSGLSALSDPSTIPSICPPFRSVSAPRAAP